MYFVPFYTAAVTFCILLIILLLLIFRIRVLVRTERDLMYLINQDQFEYILIDIRGTGDYQKGHIPTAMNVPYPECLEFLPTENMFEKIYIYGKSRYRSRIVADRLDKTGYFNVSAFGAFRSWKGPVEKAEPSNQG